MTFIHTCINLSCSNLYHIRSYYSTSAHSRTQCAKQHRMRARVSDCSWIFASSIWLWVIPSVRDEGSLCLCYLAPINYNILTVIYWYILYIFIGKIPGFLWGTIAIRFFGGSSEGKWGHQLWHHPHISQSSCWFLTSRRTLALPFCFVLCILNQIAFKSHFTTENMRKRPGFCRQHRTNNISTTTKRKVLRPPLLCHPLLFLSPSPFPQLEKAWKSRKKALNFLNNIHKFLACSASCNQLDMSL